MDLVLFNDTLTTTFASYAHTGTRLFFRYQQSTFMYCFIPVLPAATCFVCILLAMPSLLPLAPRTSTSYEAPVVESLTDAMQWFMHSCRKMFATGSLTQEEFDQSLTCRTLTASSACSGVETPSVGDSMITAGAQSLIDEHGSPQHTTPVTITTLYAIEPDTKCQEELIAMGTTGPLCIFDNILDFISDKSLRRSCIAWSSAKAAPPDPGYTRHFSIHL